MSSPGGEYGQPDVLSLGSGLSAGVGRPAVDCPRMPTCAMVVASGSSAYSQLPKGVLRQDARGVAA